MFKEEAEGEGASKSKPKPKGTEGGKGQEGSLHGQVGKVAEDEKVT